MSMFSYRNASCDFGVYYDFERLVFLLLVRLCHWMKVEVIAHMILYQIKKISFYCLQMLLPFNYLGNCLGAGSR